jgi:oligoendopeptidase F
MMSSKQWIEGRDGDTKAPGAYCTSFAKSRSPRVYLSAYTGSFQHVSTLAHELGHAFHSWVMRDMDRAETRYPMNLAETASIFFETVVGDRLIEMAKTPEEKLRYSWYDAEAAGAFLLNIPARFDFESAIHQAKAEGKAFNPDFLRETMTDAWKGRYGEALSEYPDACARPGSCPLTRVRVLGLVHRYGEALSEYDPMFWASKLHFHMTGVQVPPPPPRTPAPPHPRTAPTRKRAFSNSLSAPPDAETRLFKQFYNFPYTFGYLFALGVYAQQEAKGEKFHGAYVDLLRDTGAVLGAISTPRPRALFRTVLSGFTLSPIVLSGFTLSPRAHDGRGGRAEAPRDLDRGAPPPPCGIIAGREGDVRSLTPATNRKAKHASEPDTQPCTCQHALGAAAKTPDATVRFTF